MEKEELKQKSENNIYKDLFKKIEELEKKQIIEYMYNGPKYGGKYQVIEGNDILIRTVIFKEELPQKPIYQIKVQIFPGDKKDMGKYGIVFEGTFEEFKDQWFNKFSL